MNREIKFRAWDNINNEMRYPAKKDVFATGPTSGDFIDKWDNVMQFTGTNDAYGKDIYESDIVDWPTPDEGTLRCDVRWYKGGFFLFPIGKAPYHYPIGDWASMCEVQGNIHEHPHLIS